MLSECVTRLSVEALSFGRVTKTHFYHTPWNLTHINCVKCTCVSRRSSPSTLSRMHIPLIRMHPQWVFTKIHTIISPPSFLKTFETQMLGCFKYESCEAAFRKAVCAAPFPLLCPCSAARCAATLRALSSIVVVKLFGACCGFNACFLFLCLSFLCVLWTFMSAPDRNLYSVFGFDS